MKNETVFGCFVGVFAVIGAVILGAITNGFALTVLWRWFVMPLFEVHALSIAHAIGLSLLVGMFGSSDYKSQDDTASAIFHIFWVVIGRPAFALAAGWIVLQWV